MKRFLWSNLIVLTIMGIILWGIIGFGTWKGSSPHQGVLILTNGNFITMTDSIPHVISDRALVIENGIIEGFIEEENLPSDAQIIDLNRGFVLPGLFDMHVHFGGLPFVDGHGIPGMLVQMLRNYPDARRQFLEYGITTVTSLGDSHPRILNIRDDVASGRLEGPRIRAAGPMLTSPDGHPVSTIFEGNRWAIASNTRQLDTIEDARSTVNTLADEGVDLIKAIYTAGHRDNLPRMKFDVLEAIVSEAHSRGLQVVVHTDTPKDVEGALNAGADGLEHLGWPVSRDTTGVFELLSESNVGLIPTLTVMTRGMASEQKEIVYQEFRNQRESGGIMVVLGTDAGNLPAGSSVYNELKVFNDAGLSPFEALQTATIHAARHAGLENQLGTLETGKLADIIVFNTNPLEEFQNLEKPVMVFKEGRRIFD